MAGLYPDVPAPRMAYHRDGSVGFFHQPGSGELTVMSQENLDTLNDEDSDSVLIIDIYTLNNRYWGLIFPELRDIVGYFVAAVLSGGPSTGHVQTSTDTTNGMDGTWTQQLADWVNGGLSPAYRSNIQTVSWTGVKAVRFKVDGGSTSSDVGNVYHWHLYGTPNAAATRYLAVTDTGGTEVGGAYFDFGDKPRGGTPEIKQFKVKNLHGTLTANTITVGRQAMSEKSPIFLDDYEFSSDGVAYASSLSLGNLAPGASTGTLYVRRTTPINAQLGLETGLITVSAASWS